MVILSIASSSDNFYINLVHCVFYQFKLSKMLLISLPFFWASLCKSVLRLAYCFKNGSCLSSNILWIFLIVILNLNKSLSFGSVVCIFLLPKLRINFVVLTRKKLLYSIICVWYSDSISSVTCIFSPAEW